MACLACLRNHPSPGMRERGHLRKRAESGSGRLPMLGCGPWVQLAPTLPSHEAQHSDPGLSCFELGFCPLLRRAPSDPDACRTRVQVTWNLDSRTPGSELGVPVKGNVGPLRGGGGGGKIRRGLNESQLTCPVFSLLMSRRGVERGALRDGELGGEDLCWLPRSPAAPAPAPSQPTC